MLKLNGQQTKGQQTPAFLLLFNQNSQCYLVNTLPSSDRNHPHHPYWNPSGLPKKNLTLPSIGQASPVAEGGKDAQSDLRAAAAAVEVVAVEGCMVVGARAVPGVATSG